MREFKPGEPMRFFGPVTEMEAARLTDDVLDSEKIRLIIHEFAAGDIEPRELAYKIQCLLEVAEERLNSKDPECCDREAV